MLRRNLICHDIAPNILKIEVIKHFRNVWVNPWEWRWYPHADIRCEVKWEVVSVTLVHYFHTKIARKKWSELSSSCPNLYPALADSFSVVSRISEEVTSEPCIAEKSEPPNTPATPSMWNGCIRMLCSAWNTIMKLKVPEIPRGIPSEKDPCPIG
ncbi:unnamed protein product [Bathycoccus prasinos]